MKQSPRTMGLHNVLTTWCFFIGFTASTFFPPHRRISQSTSARLAFRAATGRGGEGSSSPASVYNLLGLSCRHKCCQMSPILRIPFTFKAFHLCISVHGQKTRLVQGSGIKHPRLSNDKKCSKSFKRNPEHKSPAKAQRSAVFLKPVLKVLLSLPIATRRLLPIPMTTIY